MATGRSHNSPSRPGDASAAVVPTRAWLAGAATQAATALGMALTGAEAEGPLGRFVGVKGWPGFRRGHCDQHA